MPQVLYEKTLIVRIQIEGEKRARFPKCPDDGGVIAAFIHWMKQMKIVPIAINHPQVGKIDGYFSQEDSEKVLGFLKMHGVLDRTAE